MQTLFSLSVLVGNAAGFALFVLMYWTNRYYTWPAVPGWPPDRKARHKVLGWTILVVALDAALACGAGCTAAIFPFESPTSQLILIVLCYGQLLVVPLLWRFARQAARRMWQ